MTIGMTGTQIIAREIAMWHGSHITGPTRTIASDHGYGSWGHSPERYADNHWREYIGAAERMLERINRVNEQNARCNYPNCDGGPATGYCRTSCKDAR